MANSYLNRTTGSPTNSAIWTLSAWIKRSSLSGSQKFFAAGSSGTDRTEMYFAGTTGEFYIYRNISGSTIELGSTRMFRDTSAWYNFVVQNNNGTVAVYVNGETVSMSNSTSLGTNKINNASTAHYIGRQVADTSQNFDGYMSHVSFVDGSVVAPTVFGETDSTSGIWKFKSPSGVTWGNNGFHLKFENSGNLGLDSSGQSNNFTTNGDVKQSLDTPSNVHSVWNVSNPTLPPTVRYGNTEIYTNANSWRSAFTTLGANTGKWYMEMKWGGGSHLTPGFSTMNVPSHNPDFTDIINAANNGGYPISLYTNGVIYENGSNEGSYGSGTSFSVNDIIMLAMDLDNNKLYWGKNGTWFNSANPAGNTGGYSIDANYTSSMFGFAISVYNTTAQCNFGDGFFGTTAIASAGSNGNGSLFEYDVPSGFYALNTNNINTYG